MRRNSSQCRLLQTHKNASMLAFSQWSLVIRMPSIRLVLNLISNARPDEIVSLTSS